MRELVIDLIALLGLIWLAAVALGFAAKPLKLTERPDWVGRLARVCRAVAVLSP